ADRNRSHWSTSKTPSYTKSVSWQHHRIRKAFTGMLMAFRLMRKKHLQEYVINSLPNENLITDELS
ncbi:hypothetical protein, partial [Escherichia coli]|uniref:hypothetical protein n=1 Tax=Escherichia coli TaxID=562 RepID=UPI001BFC3AD7